MCLLCILFYKNYFDLQWTVSKWLYVTVFYKKLIVMWHFLHVFTVKNIDRSCWTTCVNKHTFLNEQYSITKQKICIFLFKFLLVLNLLLSNWVIISSKCRYSLRVTSIHIIISAVLMLTKFNTMIVLALQGNYRVNYPRLDS